MVDTKEVTVGNNIFLTRAQDANEIFDFWIQNLQRIKEMSTKGIEFNNLIALGIFSLAEAVSANLFHRNSRYYFEKKLEINNSHILYEVFRNGFTHSFKPISLKYADDYLNWGFSSDNSPSGFRPYDEGYIDPNDGEIVFPPEVIFEYVRINGRTLHASLRLDRLVVKIESDLLKRKASLKPGQKIDFIIAKKELGMAPSGAEEVSYGD